MQEEKKGWGESGVLSAGHSVAPAARHRPPWPLHPTRHDAAPSQGCMSEQKEKEMSHFPGQKGQPSGTGEGWIPRRNSGMHPRLWRGHPEVAELPSSCPWMPVASQ